MLALVPALPVAAEEMPDHGCVLNWVASLLPYVAWLSLLLPGRRLTWEELHSSQCEVEASELAT